jgi:thiol:disulfide interchange protein
MNQSTERIEQFKADVAAMRLRDPAAGRDRLLGRLGVLAMVAGLGVAVVAWFLSHGTENPLQQRDAIVQAVIGLVLAVVGAALFVKAAMATFLRFWMARLCYEQQAQADRLAEAVRERPGAHRDLPQVLESGNEERGQVPTG